VRTCAALILTAGALATGGCGREEAGTTTAPPPAAKMALTVYELRGGLLRPHVVRVSRSRVVAAAALRALGVAARVTVERGTARVRLG